MQIIIFHYHLNPGGVTRIIESQVAGFRKEFPDLSIKVLTGFCENPEFYAGFDVELIVNPELNYLEQKAYDKAELESKYNSISQFLKDQTLEYSIIHAHNINLGKNPLVTIAVNQLLKEGKSVINHAHDFSEDRPNNQAFLHHIIEEVFDKDPHEVMYPSSSRYKIGVLNRFDFDRVLDLGIEEENAFLFPNPVYVPLKEKPDKAKNREKLIELFEIPKDKLIITYPVRVIERKNIGELILLAALFTDCQFLVTLPPRNPVEIKRYDKWKAFCSTNKINLIFEAGEKGDFIEIISGSDYCITTSMKEGFGMAYLEPWLIGTPVVGRNIDYVTSDIKNEGVKFPFIYDKLLVNSACQTIDFKLLNMNEQQAVILSVCNKEINAEQIIALNPAFKGFPPTVSTVEVVENQKTIIDNFSIEEYAKRIYRAYKTLPR